MCQGKSTKKYKTKVFALQNYSKIKQDKFNRTCIQFTRYTLTEGRHDSQGCPRENESTQ